MFDLFYIFFFVYFILEYFVEFTVSQRTDKYFYLIFIEGKCFKCLLCSTVLQNAFIISSLCWLLK